MVLLHLQELQLLNFTKNHFVSVSSEIFQYTRLCHNFQPFFYLYVDSLEKHIGNNQQILKWAKSLICCQSLCKLHRNISEIMCISQATAVPEHSCCGYSCLIPMAHVTQSQVNWTVNRIWHQNISTTEKVKVAKSLQVSFYQ